MKVFFAIALTALVAVCYAQQCTPGEFACNDGKCIPQSWVCDDYADCTGGEDEDQDCPPCNGYVCRDGHCIPEIWLCDGLRDCMDGDDEIGCPCDGGHVCESGQCIPSHNVCDGFVDCSDGSDERNCTYQAKKHMTVRRNSAMHKGLKPRSPNHIQQSKKLGQKLANKVASKK